MKTLHHSYDSTAPGWPLKHMWYDAWRKLEPPVSPFSARVALVGAAAVLSALLIALSHKL